MRILNFLKNILKSLFIGIVLAYILLKFLIMPCQVDGSSMYPNLKDKQIGYSFIITKNIKVNRFDIVIIDPKIENDDKLLVKRIIGLPNETIEYKNNELYIDGQLVDEYFLGDDIFTEDFSVTLGDGEYCCLGDNRENSRDSRYYGAFTIDNFRATHFFVLYPFDELGVKK